MQLDGFYLTIVIAVVLVPVVLVPCGTDQLVTPSEEKEATEA